MSIGDPVDGGSAPRALRARRASGGFVVAVDDDEIGATGHLPAAPGLVVKPASGASVAEALAALRAPPGLRGGTFVCLVTSAGLKWLDDHGQAARGDELAAPAARARRQGADWVG